MKMTGEYVLDAPRQEVWAALNDPAILKDCIPGCESIEKISDTEMEAVAKMKVGPVSARFKGKVTLSDLDPPNGYTITGDGTGGAAGFAKGGAKVQLADTETGGTRLAYDVDAQVGGKLAQIGQRLVDQTAKKMADEFFARFAGKVGGSPAEATGAAEPQSADSETRQPEPTVDPALVAAAATAGPAPVIPEVAGTPRAAGATPAHQRDTHPGSSGNIARWASIILLVILVLALVYYVRT